MLMGGLPRFLFGGDSCKEPPPSEFPSIQILGGEGGAESSPPVSPPMNSAWSSLLFPVTAAAVAPAPPPAPVMSVYIN